MMGKYIFDNEKVVIMKRYLRNLLDDNQNKKVKKVLCKLSIKTKLLSGHSEYPRENIQNIDIVIESLQMMN